MPFIPPAWQGDADKRNEPLTPLEVEAAWERFYNGDQDLDVTTVMRLFVTVDKLRDQANMADEATAQAGRREAEARATLDAWRPFVEFVANVHYTDQTGHPLEPNFAQVPAIFILEARRLLGRSS